MTGIEQDWLFREINQQRNFPNLDIKERKSQIANFIYSNPLLSTPTPMHFYYRYLLRCTLQKSL